MPGKEVVNCDKKIKTIADLAKFTDQTTHTVTVRNNEILKLTPGCHANDKFKNITTYQLLSVGTLEVEDSGFSGLGNLQNLKLGACWMKTLKKGIFKGIPSIQRIEITDCDIDEIEDGAFEGCENLESLNISSNKLTTLSKSFFADLKNLVSLNISKNEIDNLEEDCFSSLANLKDLDISNNTLNTLKPSVFSTIPNLTYLYVNFCEIENIDGTFDCKELKYLYMKDNRLQNLPAGVFAGSQKLVEIDLDYNEFTAMDENAFNDLPELKTLQLKNCLADINNLKFVAKPSIII